MDNIVFGEALGEGAFGKVYCATVTGVMLQSPSISCESLDKYVKMGPTRPASFFGSSVIMKAAVKVLQGTYHISLTPYYRTLIAFSLICLVAFTINIFLPYILEREIIVILGTNGSKY